MATASVLMAAMVVVTTSAVSATPPDWEVLASVPPAVVFRLLKNHCKPNGKPLTAKPIGKLDLEYTPLSGTNFPIISALSRHESPDEPGCRQQISSILTEVVDDWARMKEEYKTSQGRIEDLVATAVRLLCVSSTDSANDDKLQKIVFDSPADFEAKLKPKIKLVAESFAKDSDSKVKSLGQKLLKSQS